MADPHRKEFAGSRAAGRFPAGGLVPVEVAGYSAFVSKPFFLGLVLFILACRADALQAPGAETTVDLNRLKVGTYECPPFVIRETDGRWSGLGISLWKDVAEQLGRPYVLEELELPALLTAAEQGRIDVGVSCISITPEREERVDFSHSLHEAHLAIAARPDTTWSAIVRVLTDAQTLYWLGILALVASCVGGVYYALEHRINPKIYSRPTALGRVLEAFLLGLLSITRGPVNYYEFKTLPGRTMTVLLAVSTTLFLASFTAVLASAFTLDRLRANITGPADLRGLRGGSKQGATAQRYLDRRGIAHRTYADLPGMLEDLDRGRLDAVVADDPVLRYEIKRGTEAGRYSALKVLPYRFERQNYGLVLREDPEFHESIDRALLKVRESEAWAERLSRYLGTRN